MKRLALAAVLAVGIHILLFQVDLSLIPPRPLAPPSRAPVAIDLVPMRASRAPVRKPPPLPAPDLEPVQPLAPLRLKAEPPPAPKPVPKPVAPEPRPQPRIEPDAVPAVRPDTSQPAEAPGRFESEAAEDTDRRTSEDPGAQVSVSVPLYDRNPPIDYPPLARRRNYEGTVVLDVLVAPDGTAAQVRVARSSGYAILDRSAEQAVRAWRFEPARRGRTAVEMWVQVPVRYALE